MKEKTQSIYPDGEFVHIANSRSGHNFIRKNIYSFFNDEEQLKREYFNLENGSPKAFRRTSNNPNSIYILSTRDLLNWYRSITRFHENTLTLNSDKKPILTKEAKKRIKNKYVGKKIVFQSDVLKNPELMKDPDVYVLADGTDIEKHKTRYLDYIANPPKDWYETWQINKVKRVLDHWLIISKEFVNETEYIPEFQRLYYDEFVKSRAYRKEICNNLGGEYNENMIEFVPGAGGHSTFDRNKYKDRGSEMEVLERYKLFDSRDDGFLLKLKEHPAMDFYLKNFEVDKDKKKFINSIK